MKKSLKIRKQLLAKTLRLKKQLRKNTKKMKAMKPYLRKHFRKTAAYKKTIPPMKRWKETAAPYGTEAASAADPSLSEDDEWLYSKPRRFAKKPANEQKN